MSNSFKQMKEEPKWKNQENRITVLCCDLLTNGEGSLKEMNQGEADGKDREVGLEVQLYFPNNDHKDSFPKNDGWIGK